MVVTNGNQSYLETGPEGLDQAAMHQHGQPPDVPARAREAGVHGDAGHLPQRGQDETTHLGEEERIWRGVEGSTVSNGQYRYIYI